MKLFAFSDWRKRSLDSIRRAIEKEEPDLVLYLGDDLEEMVSYYNDKFVYPPGVKWGRWTEKKIMLHPDWNREEAEKLLAFTLATEGMDAVLSLSEKNKKEIKRRKLDVEDFSQNLETILDQHLKGIGHYVVLGNAFSINAACKYENKQGFFESLQIPVFFVNGNDGPVLYEDGIWYLAVPTMIYPGMSDRGWIPIKEAPTIGSTTFTKNGETISLFGLYSSWGKESQPLNLPDQYTDIILSHVPPQGCLDLARRYGINHIGSRELREATERYSPKLLLCGHVHQFGGQMMRLNETTVVNVSSHDIGVIQGNYAIILTSDWSVELKNIEWNPKPVIRLFSVRGGHSLLRETKKRMLETESVDERMRLMDLARFLSENPEWSKAQQALRELGTMGIGNGRLERRVEAKERGMPIFKDYFTLNPQGCVFVDVETGSFKEGGIGKLWLIGVLLDGMVRQYEYPDQWDGFLEFLHDHQVKSLASWTKYDHDVLRPLLQEAGVQLKFIDVCQRTANHMHWDAYALDAVYALLFPEENLRDKDEITGLMAGMYASHLILQNDECPWCPSVNEIKQRITKKNWTDLWRTYRIAKRLYENSQDRGRKVLGQIAEIYKDEYGEPLRTERVDWTVYKNTIKPILEKFIKNGVPHEDIRCLVTVLGVSKRVRDDVLHHLCKISNEDAET